MSFRTSHLLIIAALATVAVIVLLPVWNFRILFGIVLFAAIALLLKPVITRKTKSDAVETDKHNTAQEVALTKLFDATMNGMREGLLVVNDELRVIASNRAAHELFPFAGDRLNSRRLTELTRDTQIYTAFIKALKERSEQSGLRIETADRRMFDLRVVPLADVDGSGSPGALGVFFDITRLERLERVRQEFLSNVSHELRTPLTAILASVETIQTAAVEDDESSSRFLEIIRKNAARMHDLINDILELSAIEAGNVQVKPEEIELRPVISDVINSVGVKASVRTITIINEVPAAVTVHADGRRLEQMLTNLIDNAIKFNRDAGRIVVRYENGERHRIHVEDTGEGISSQYLPRLFERFYRVDRARSRDLGGTGLGLAIVKHLAKAHGGEVTVRSSLGQGSIFTIELPRMSSAQPEPHSSELVSASP